MPAYNFSLNCSQQPAVLIIAFHQVVFNWYILIQINLEHNVDMVLQPRHISSYVTHWAIWKQWADEPFRSHLTQADNTGIAKVLPDFLFWPIHWASNAKSISMLWRHHDTTAIDSWINYCIQSCAKQSDTCVRLSIGGTSSQTIFNAGLYIQWHLSITTTYWDTSLPSGAHLGGQGPPRWALEGRNCYQE